MAGHSPSGWFVDPWQPGRLRYWDGTAWTSFERPATPGQPSGQGLGDGFGILAGWLAGLLALNAVVAAATVAVEGWGALMIAGEAAAESPDIPLLGVYDTWSALVAQAALLGLLAAGVVWLVWQHRIARAVPRQALRRSPGMHVGSWFIPVLTLWYPFQNLVDLRRATRPDAPEAQAALWGWWWALWIGSSILGTFSSLVLQGADSLTDFVGAAGVAAFVAAVEVVSAVAAVGVVRSLSRSALATLPS